MTVHRSRVVRILGSGWAPYAAVSLVFAVSRVGYRLALDVRFDSSPVSYFIQYLNPWFVEHDFLRSLLYLHQQAPLQNLLTGSCIRIFGTPLAFTVLEAIYVALGLTTVLSLLHVMLRLGVSRAIAASAAALYAASPVTVFYENWLFYHQPVAALLLLSFVALLRYYRLGTFRAGLWFFGLFAGAGLFYTLFGPLLLVAVTLALLVRPPNPDRQGVSPRIRMVLALSLPLCLLLLDKARTRVLVGHAQGDAFLWENLAVKTFDAMRPGERQLLVDAGLISRAPGLVLFSLPLSAYDGDLRVPHALTGVPLLDLDSMPDGQANAHALEKVLIAETYYKKDAKYLLGHAYDVYGRSVFQALTKAYFMSPLDYDHTLSSPNRDKLKSFVQKTDSLFLPDADGTQRVLVAMLPATFLYGLYRVLGARGTLESERSTVAAISCILSIALYVTLATAVVAVGDFSRYRFNVDPFYLILFALLATDCTRGAAAQWRRAMAWRRSRLAT